MNTTERQLTNALTELAAPGTPDGVADLLRSHNIKGVRHQAAFCVIAEFLRMRGLRNPVFSAGIHPRVSVYEPGGTIVWADAPTVLGETADRFDDGVYLDLATLPGGTK